MDDFIPESLRDLKPKPTEPPKHRSFRISPMPPVPPEKEMTPEEEARFDKKLDEVFSLFLIGCSVGGFIFSYNIGNIWLMAICGGSGLTALKLFFKS